MFRSKPFRIVAVSAAAAGLLATGVGVFGGGAATAATPAAERCGAGYRDVHHDIQVKDDDGNTGPGVVKVYWNPNVQKNCAILLRTGDANGVAGKTTLKIDSPVANDSKKNEQSDSGQYSRYAGPVYVYAPQCISVDATVEFDGKLYSGNRDKFSCGMERPTDQASDTKPSGSDNSDNSSSTSPQQKLDDAKDAAQKAYDDAVATYGESSDEAEAADVKLQDAICAAEPNSSGC